MEVPDHSATGNQPKAQPDELKNWANELNRKEGNEDKKRSLEDVNKALAWASILVEGLDNAKNREHHSWKLNKSQADQDLVR